jgi:hypothetical protein
MRIKKQKRGQEEFVGFGVIIIVVAVALLIFLSFALKKGSQKQGIESYEVESFIQSVLQYTTDCEDNIRYLPIQKIVFDCTEDVKCLNGRKTCDVLNETLEGIMQESWLVEEDSLVKGYELEVFSEENEILKISKGNFTNNYKGAEQLFSEGGDSIKIAFSAYY